MSEPVTVQNVQVVVTCPACGAEDYEVEFDGEEVASATQVSLRCDECPATILVDVSVYVQSRDCGCVTSPAEPPRVEGSGA